MATYIPPSLVDVEDNATGHVIPGTWRNEALPSSWPNYQANCSNNYSGDAKTIREEYLQCFNDGVVHSQWLQCGIVHYDINTFVIFNIVNNKS